MNGGFVAEQLKCERMIKVFSHNDAQGKAVYYSKRCDLAPARYWIAGLLTEAEAVLCSRHKFEADRQAFVSQNGYPMGKVEKSAKEDGYHQDRLPMTGVIGTKE